MGSTNDEKISTDIYSISPCYLFSFSNEGFITRSNDTLLIQLGYEATEIINIKKIGELLMPGSRIFFQTHFYPLIKLHGNVEEIFLSFLTKDKKEIPVLLNAKLIGNANEFEIHCAGMKILNRNRFEKELIEARHVAEKALLENDSLVKLTAELDKNQQLLELQLQRLAHNNKEHQQINSVISHDLQEPLRKVSIFSIKLLEEAAALLDEKSLVYLEKINKASEKMNQLVQHLQRYLDYHSRLPQIAENNLETIFNDAIHSSGILEKEIQTRFFIDELKMIFAYTDREMMTTLFTQLLDNSVKFSDPKNDFLDIRVEIKIVEQNIFKEITHRYKYKEYWRLSYSDNGIGFENKYASDIFEIFRKAHITEGLGLGLTYCKKIMELQQGFISASSRPGVGTTFTILIPIKKA